MPPIPTNPIDPTFKIIKQDIKYYLKVGDDSTDVGTQIANAALSITGMIPLPDFISPLFSAFGLLNGDWGPPPILDFTPLFNKFEEQLMDQID